MYRFSALITLLVCATTAAAARDGPYWFVVASFEQRGTAEEYISQSSLEIVEPLEILVAIAADGSNRYRVAAGPYDSRDVANDRGANLAHAFPDAWVVVAPRPDVGYPSWEERQEPDMADDEGPVDNAAQRAPLRIDEEREIQFNRLHRDR